MSAPAPATAAASRTRCGANAPCGKSVAPIISALIATLGALISSQSRLPMVLAHDGLFPRLFARRDSHVGTPVISVNVPGHNKHGSVGQFLPDIEYRLEPVPDFL